MTTPTSSDWQAFDPSAGSLPETLPPPHLEGGAGEGVVAVVASGRTAGSEWGPRAALEIARQWAQGGARVMLADLGLEHPTLHRVAGLENGEGMSDVFLFGASIQRIARPVDDGSFFLAPAGTVTADPPGIMEHTRWQALEEGFGSAQAVLMLYVPEGDAALPGVVKRAAHVILLGEEGTEPSHVLDSATDRLLATLSPAGTLDGSGPDEDFRFAPQDGGAPPGIGQPSPDEADEVEEAPVREEEAATGAAPGDEFEEIPDRRRTTLWIFLILVLVVVGAAAAVWFGYVEIPGLELPGSGGP